MRHIMDAGKDLFYLQITRQNPSFSPASIAGRVRIIRLTSCFLNASIAIAIARYVFPVPAGPTPNTIILLRISSTYFFCPTVFGFTGFPEIVRQMISLSISSTSLLFSEKTLKSYNQHSAQSQCFLFVTIQAAYPQRFAPYQLPLLFLKDESFHPGLQTLHQRHVQSFYITVKLSKYIQLMGSRYFHNCLRNTHTLTSLVTLVFAVPALAIPEYISLMRLLQEETAHSFDSLSDHFLL